MISYIQEKKNKKKTNILCQQNNLNQNIHQNNRQYT